MRDVDIDGGDSATEDADTRVGPLRPDRELGFGRGPGRMPIPFGIVPPGFANVAARFLAAGCDRQNAIAIGDEPLTELGHEAWGAHQNGILSVVSNRRA